jgi:predicted SAM-dependent methyltransferase
MVPLEIRHAISRYIRNPIKRFFKYRGIELRTLWQSQVLGRYRLGKGARPLRIIVGAGGTSYQGWISTQIEFLNLLTPNHWERYFTPDSIDAILAEHVWEHLTTEEGILAAKMCFKYLRPGGHLRIAVPDGLHPDPEYIEYVRPGGSHWAEKDHKVLYTYQSLRDIFVKVGFQVELLEYFDEEGKPHHKEWNPEDGFICRSIIHPSDRLWQGKQGEPLNYSSIILDARKPT